VQFGRQIPTFRIELWLWNVHLSVPPISLSLSLSLYIYIYIYRCARGNVPDFYRMFLILKYADIIQNTYVQSWTVTDIMAREQCGLLAGPRTVPVSWQVCPWVWCRMTADTSRKLHMCFLQGTLPCTGSHVMSVVAIHVSCIVLGIVRTTLTWRASFFVVQLNGFMSLTSYFDATYIINITETTYPCQF
jgi:ABC-type antimicrobial peptide transport system permease subunit